MDKKLTYIHSIITSPGFKFKSKKDGEFNFKLFYNQDGLLIFRIANNKELNLEENFKSTQHHYSPSCFVILDNRENMQQIAIEEDTKSFSSTDVVRNILEYTLKKHLRHNGLTIEIKKEYEQNEFWQLIGKQTKGVSMIRFTLSYPNLGRVHDSIEHLLNSESKAVNSKQTELEFRSDNTEQLELQESDTQLVGLVKASADSGNTITIKARGIRKFIRTGETTKSFEIDDLEAKIQSPDLFQNISDLLNSAQQ
ncbi:hypothetical protein [Bacteroides zoogleoformans]|uniref:hypothetical protein n=1 Tax=Bacteroides zoogleoformans TaxID=28119 RepID=UPI00248EF392|nr:hypothetical protein [Bacteroides zoogleoformans]